MAAAAGAAGAFAATTGAATTGAAATGAIGAIGADITGATGAGLACAMVDAGDDMVGIATSATGATAGVFAPWAVLPLATAK